jgi:hypothetical protein
MALEGDRGAGGVLKRVGAAAVVVDDPGCCATWMCPATSRGLTTKRVGDLS